MYRHVTDPSRFAAITGGDYAGPARVIDLRQAPADVRAKLAQVARQEGPVRAIFMRKTGLSPTWGIFPAAFMDALGLLGFGSVDTPAQGLVSLLLYAPLAALSTYAVQQRLFGVGNVADGAYLLPFDYVEIARGHATVLPLGSLRNAKANGNELELVWGDGTRKALVFGSRAQVKDAITELEATHAELVQLSLGSSHVSALVHDPFVSVRGAALWEATPARGTPRWAIHSLVWVVALALSFGFLRARNHMSREAAAAREHAWNPPTEPAPSELPSSLPSASAFDLTRLQVTPEGELSESERMYVAELIHTGELAYAPLAPKNAAPNVVQAVLARGRTTGHRSLLVSFSAEDKSTLAWHNRNAGAYFEGRVIAGLRHAFAQSFSPVVLSVAEGNESEADLSVRYTVMNARLVNSEADALADVFAFHVALRDPSDPKKHTVATFDLTMPPAHAPPSMRERSLFAPPSTPERRMAARAYDRLYDELYALFFTGPIRVPLGRAEPPLGAE